MKKIHLFLRRYLRGHDSTRQFIKFAIVGSVSAVINFGFFYGLTEWAGLWYLASSVVGFLLSVVFNFLANKFWTFRNSQRGRHFWQQMMKFCVVMVVGVTMNTSIIYAVTEGFGLHHYLSWFFATLVVAVWNFTMNRSWTFKARPKSFLDFPESN